MNTEEILVKLGVDTKTAKAGMEGMKDYLLDWARAMRTAIVGAFAVEGIKEVFEKNIEYGEKIYDLSKRLAISAEAVQSWDYALKQNGSSIDAATGFFEKFGTARDKAMEGNGQAIQAFKELGVSIDDLKSKRLEDIAEQIGDVFKAGGDPQALIGALREVGGRAAGEMIPTMVKGIKEAREEAQKLGLVLSDDVISQLKSAGDEWKQLGNRLRSATAPWVASVVEGLDTIFYAFKGLFYGIENFFSKFIEAKKTEGFVQAMKDAGKAFMEGEQKAWDEQMASDRARRQAQSAAAAPGVIEEHADNTEKIKNLKKEAHDNEERAHARTKTNQEQMNDLVQKRLALMAEGFMNRGDELAHAQTMLDISKTDLEIAQKQKDLDHDRTEEQKRQNELAKDRERIGFLQQRRDEELLQPAQSSISEIARSGWWSRQSGFSGGRWQWNQGPFAGIAQEIERLQADGKNSLLYYGNKDRAKADLARAGVLRGQLEDVGLVSPERRLESIDEEIKRLNQSLADGSASVSVANGE